MKRRMNWSEVSFLKKRVGLLMSANNILLYLLLINGVACQQHGDVRLVGGDIDSEGTVEVYSESEGWGTICDRNWSDNDGHVVCRQLGKDNASEIYLGAHFGVGSGSVILQGLNCLGNESNLFQCQVSKPFITCDHTRDAGVQCSPADSVNSSNNVNLTIALLVPFGVIIMILVVIVVIFIILTLRYDKDAIEIEEIRIKEKRFITGMSLKEQRSITSKKGLFRRKNSATSSKELSSPFTVPREALGEGTPHPWQLTDEEETESDVDETESHFKYESELTEQDETVGAINPVLVDKLKQELENEKKEKPKIPKKYKKQAPKNIEINDDSELESDNDITPYELSTSFSFSS